MPASRDRIPPSAKYVYLFAYLLACPRHVRALVRDQEHPRATTQSRLFFLGFSFGNLAALQKVDLPMSRGIYDENCNLWKYQPDLCVTYSLHSPVALEIPVKNLCNHVSSTRERPARSSPLLINYGDTSDSMPGTLQQSSPGPCHICTAIFRHAVRLGRLASALSDR